MSIYADKRNGVYTGRWCVELKRGGKHYRKRHDVHADAVRDEREVRQKWAAEAQTVPQPSIVPAAQEVPSLRSSRRDHLLKIECLMSVVRSVVHATVPTQVVHTLVAVALNEGKSANDLATIIGSNSSTASRHLLDLGSFDRNKQPGYALVESRPDPMNRRSNMYSLTPKGRGVVDALVAIMEA